MSSTSPSAALPLGEIVAESFRLPWRRRGDFAKALALPALAIVAIRVGWWQAGQPQGAIVWAAWVAHGLAWILFAVACHRLVLLDLRRDQIAWFPGWGRRETVFALSVALIGVAVSAAALLAMTLVGIVVTNLFQPLFEAFHQPVIYVFSTYLFARVALMLPAAAIGDRVHFQETWRRTRGNGWRLAFVVGVLPWALAYASYWIGGDEPGVATAVATTALATLLIAVEICALSLSYRWLVPKAQATG